MLIPVRGKSGINVENFNHYIQQNPSHCFRYGILLAARGPYMEWHNKHENMTVERPNDKFKSAPNTIVHVAEFKQVIRDALDLAEQHLKTYHDEL